MSSVKIVENRLIRSSHIMPVKAITCALNLYPHSFESWGALRYQWGRQKNNDAGHRQFSKRLLGPRSGNKEQNPKLALTSEPTQGHSGHVTSETISNLLLALIRCKGA